MSKTFKDHSRTGWHNNKQSYPGDEEIKIGCLQRIADATEMMARDNQRLSDDLKWYEKRCKELRDSLDTERRRTARYKGLYRKCNRRIAQLISELVSLRYPKDKGTEG